MGEVQLLGARRRAIQFACSTIACLSCGYASAPLLAQSTTTHLSFIGASGEAQFAFSPDSCTTVTGDLFVAASGSQGASSNAPPMALASLSTVNTCTKTYTSEFGLTSTFQFSSQGGNGTDTPRVVTASGQIPLTGLPGGQTDLLGFQLTLNRVGLAYELDGSTHSTYPSGTPLVVSHFANTVSLANATLSAWTQQGALPLTVYYAVVSNNKSHEVDVTR